MARREGVGAGPPGPLPLSGLKRLLPAAEAFCPGLEVVFDELVPLRDSSSMTPRDWITIARRIAENYDAHDGFVVIHGTDTMSYTASALSFMLENLAKPVVLTGSQLPLDDRRGDALANYGHALMIAGHKACGLPPIPEVVVVFADRILRGCRSRKMSASAWRGFDSPNCPPLGETGTRVRVFEERLRPAPPPDSGLKLITSLDERVLDITLTPALTPTQVRDLMRRDDVRGVVLRTYGSGNAPEDPAFLRALEEGIRHHGKVVVNITQCPQGMVEMGHYAASTGLIGSGVISGLDMTPEAALTKLMVLLGAHASDEAGRRMQRDMRGELSENPFDPGFGHPEEFTAQP